MPLFSLFRSLRGKKRRVRDGKRAHPRLFRRPYLEELESRILLSGEHYLLTTPASLVAGSPLLVEVQAVNDAGLDTSYAGTAQVSCTDPQVGLRTIPFSQGIGLLATTLKTAGSGTFTATDTSDTTITGTSNVIQVSAGSPVKLAFVTQPTSVATGYLLPAVAVQVEDQFGNRVSGDNSDVVSLSVSQGPGSFAPTSTVTQVVQGGRGDLL